MSNNLLQNNFLALVYKLPNISSANFINAIKKALIKQGINVKKIGFSGILDPFARGQLILGINGATKLLPHIDKRYKLYKAVLFLGLESASLDTENVITIKDIQKFSIEEIKKATENLHHEISYEIPQFSAKHINGVRAYKLAREQMEFDRPKVTTYIHAFRILSYNHPFLSFEICVSEGGYIRSIGEIIAHNLGIKGSLCYLERIQEGDLCYHAMCQDIANKYSKTISYITLHIVHNNITQNIKLILLDIQNALKYDTISLTKYGEKALNGASFMLDSNLCAKIFAKYDNRNTYSSEFQYHLYQNKNVTHKLSESLQLQDIQVSQKYKVLLADFDSHFAIIKVFQNGVVKYILNRINKC